MLPMRIGEIQVAGAWGLPTKIISFEFAARVLSEICQSGSWKKQGSAALNSSANASTLYPGATTVCIYDTGSTCKEFVVGSLPTMTLVLNQRDYLTKALISSFTMCNFNGTSGITTANGFNACQNGSERFMLTLDGVLASNGDFGAYSSKAFYPWK